MSWRADESFNELPPLPPAVKVLETTETLKARIGARASLAELKQAAELLPYTNTLWHKNRDPAYID